MFKYYFERIEGIENGPLVSLIIFFVFFVLVTAWVFFADKKYMNYMKDLPLDEHQDPQNLTEKQ